MTASGAAAMDGSSLGSEVLRPERDPAELNHDLAPLEKNMTTLPSLVSAGVDLLAPDGIKQVIQLALARREARARAALIASTKRGKGWRIAGSDDEVMEAVYEFAKAAADGASQINLDLLAEVLRRGTMEPTFTAEEFREVRKALGDLTYREVQLIGSMMRVRRSASPTESEAEIAAALVKRVCADISGPGRPFENQGEVHEVFGALQRTGFVRLHGNGTFATKAFGRLETLVRVDEILGEREQHVGAA